MTLSCNTIKKKSFQLVYKLPFLQSRLFVFFFCWSISTILGFASTAKIFYFAWFKKLLFALWNFICSCLVVSPTLFPRSYFAFLHHAPPLWKAPLYHLYMCQHSFVRIFFLNIFIKFISTQFFFSHAIFFSEPWHKKCPTRGI